MNLFLVIFEEAIASEEKEQAKSSFSAGGVFELSDRILLVQTPISDPKSLSMSFGLSDEAGSSNVGVVFKLDGSYYGHYYSSLWDWLKKAREVGV